MPETFIHAREKIQFISANDLLCVERIERITVSVIQKLDEILALEAKNPNSISLLLPVNSVADSFLTFDLSTFYDTANEFLRTNGMDDIPVARHIIEIAYVNMSEKTGYEASENMRRIIRPSIIYLRGARTPITVTSENLGYTQKFVWDILSWARKVLKRE